MSVTEKDKDIAADYKDTAVTAFLKKMIVCILDFALFSIANLSMCYLTQDGHITLSSYGKIAFNYPHFIMVGIMAVVVNWSLGLYRSVWRFVGNDEIVRGTVAATVETVLLFLIDRLLFPNVFGIQDRLAWFAYFLGFFLIDIAILAPRICFRILKRAILPIKTSNDGRKRVMIVGAGFMGNFVIDALINNQFKNGYPIIAVDDNPAKKGKKINSVKVVGTCADIPSLVSKYRIDEIDICVPSASKVRQKEIIDIAMKTSASVRISPSIEEFLEPGGSRKTRRVEISDLLSRPEVKLDKKVCRYLVGKTILVTGGGGSIGSEICMQVARYNPKTIVVFDIYENCAFELENELINKYGDQIDVQVRIGSVRDIDRLREIFSEFNPDVVFHAAAHKHVPLMEDSPCEAVKNNVFGTFNVAKTADEFKVPKMVIISTDKAVNPTNVMGCTKRITEIIVQYMNKISDNTQYAAVRFGNVLGSHGSVIPIFKKQIEEGGPVKVTHPDITRYFMTIPEAAQLVCQAGGIASGGEVFVLDMGEPVKIMDLAENLIKLSGYTVDEIGIEIIGLRPGEKLYEELALDSEIATRKKTANEKIYVNQPIDVDEQRFVEMMDALKNINEDNVRDVLAHFVPAYHPAEI